jgi:hypothetical protein
MPQRAGGDGNRPFANRVPRDMTTTMRLSIALCVLAAGLLLGCAGGPGATNPLGTPASTLPTPGATGAPTPTAPIDGRDVSSPAQAAALVFASDRMWARMVPLRPDMVGQSSWYEALEAADGYAVNITLGQGDCQAGCIEKHTWQYHVDFDGNVELLGEVGDPVDVPPGEGGGEGDARVTIALTAGPACPVVQDPPDPNCAERLVSGATVTIFKADGTELATTTSDEEGKVVFDVPPGAYYVVAAPVEGLMGTPEAQAFAVLGADQIGLLFQYDTGIR